MEIFPVPFLVNVENHDIVCVCKSHVFREISSQYEKRSTKALTGMLTGDVGQVTNPPLQGVTHSPAPKETSHCRRLVSPGTSVTITVPSVTLLPFCPISSTNVSEAVCLPWKGLSSHTHPLCGWHPWIHCGWTWSRRPEPRPRHKEGREKQGQ